MWLDVLWFWLLVAIIAGYLVLDGFDMGVGVLHPFVGSGDVQRRTVLNSVGPVWDGNEVWLVVGGGVLFAAFPIVYAALFSGFYWAMMLVLLTLILRTVAIEFRSKRREPVWRTTWDVVFFASSLGLALLLGVALGNIIAGVPLNSDGQVVIGSLLDLLHPFAIWLGLTTVAMLTLHGALYLNLKTEAEIRERVRAWIPRLAVTFALAAVIAAVWMWIAGYGVVRSYRAEGWPVVLPLGALLAFATSTRGLKAGREAAAFFSSAAMVVLLLLSMAVGLYPDLLTSSLGPRYSMTVWNAASAPKTLTVMLIVAVIGMPFVLLYTAGVQYLFRGKVELTDESY